MSVIKLNAIDSTNSYLKELCGNEPLEDYATVMALNQTAGRGQVGSQWNSEAGKNLTASVLKHHRNMLVHEKFNINMVVSLSIIMALSKFQIKNLSIKWPNDILAEDLKIGGILIENILKNNQLKSSIIGIGLNINQTQFSDLPRASSLRLISGQNFEPEEILNEILNQLHFNFQILKKSAERIKKSYKNNLFRVNKPSTFEDMRGNLFTGYIKGISDYGYLQVLVEDQIIKEFDLKEVKLLY